MPPLNPCLFSGVKYYLWDKGSPDSWYFHSKVTLRSMIVADAEAAMLTLLLVLMLMLMPMLTTTLMLTATLMVMVMLMWMPFIADAVVDNEVVADAFVPGIGSVQVWHS